MDEDPRISMAYDEAVKALDTQRAALDELRSRSAAVLVGAVAASSFLGRDLLKPGSVLHPPGWVAIVAFCLIAVFTAVTWLPFSWKWQSDPTWLIDEFVRHEMPFTSIRCEKLS